MSQTISVFDLDKTLVKVNCSYQFGIYLYKKRVFSLQELFTQYWFFFQYQIGFLEISEMHHKAFNRFFQGRDQAFISHLAKNFVSQYVENWWYYPALNCLKKAAEENHYIVLLSSSPSFLVEQIVFQLPLSIDKWYGTDYTVDSSRRYCKISQIIEGKKKAELIKELKKEPHLSRGDVIVYTDSYHDSPLIEVANCFIGVNPDKKLRALCRKNKWTTL